MLFLLFCLYIMFLDQTYFFQWILLHYRTRFIWEMLIRMSLSFKKLNSSPFISQQLNSHRCPCLPPTSSSLKPLCLWAVYGRASIDGCGFFSLSGQISYKGWKHNNKGLWSTGYSSCAWKISQLSESCFIVSLCVDTYRYVGSNQTCWGLHLLSPPHSCHIIVCLLLNSTVF